MTKLKWGIISTANIGIKKVIPGIQKSTLNEVIAIASRNAEAAKSHAQNLGIPKAYPSYEELLDDPEVEAVYIPLPNHLHVEWSLKALENGKHVLCEKPIGLNASEARKLQQAQQDYPGLKVMEAFMYRFHPQWIRTRKWVQEGKIGTLKAIDSVFSYFNDDPDNIRNKPEMGGGGLMDIGCYNISLSRFLFQEEPLRIQSTVEYDEKFNTDYLASGILEFSSGVSTFICGTQLNRYQRVQVIGTEGRIEIEVPFNAPPDKKTRVWLELNNEVKEVSFDICDQYSLQADAFASVVLQDLEVPTPLSDAVQNMEVIDAIFAQNPRP